jgi:pyruvate, water dikinase
MPEKRESPDFIKWFSELSNKDIATVGGKGASLAEMYNTGIPVPPGFVITAQAYQYFIKSSKLNKKISEILNETDVNETEILQNASKKIRSLIEEQTLPKEMQEAITEAYEILDAKKQTDKASEDAMAILKNSQESPFVAVRSSATTEDLIDASFAGQQDSFLNVKGNQDLLEKVKKCMSSLFTARAIYYRTKKGFEHEKSLLAVVVQKMVDSEKSGVMFSNNPISKDDSIVIEAVFGLGEGIVSGKINPDHHVISEDLENFEIESTKIADKKIAIVRNSSGDNKTVTLTPEKSKQQVLTSYEIKRLAQYAQQLEKHYKKPQDIEFAIEQNEIYIVQSRPITTKFKAQEREIEGNAMFSGLPASPGIASGTVKIIHSLTELNKIKKGDILVTKMTNPDMVVSMQKAAAIVTDDGGTTSHAAIVSREMGIPAVVGTNVATEKLKEGEVITVDGNTGKIYEGKGETKLSEVLPIVQTKTKIKVIADLPEGAKRAAKSGAKSVGLVRLEGLIALGGKHPIKFIKENKTQEYIELLKNGLKEIADPYEEIWIRTSDIRTDEYRHLEGAPQEVEGNPMMGDHGIRYALKNADILRAELTAAKEVADDHPDKKIGIMAPLIISLDELKKLKAHASEIGMPENIRLGIMVETPASVQIINELLEEGISFISFGTNDLTQFTLALDRNNPDVQDLFDETNPAVINSIKYVIRRCKKYNVETSICGQAGSKEEMAKILVQEGIDSISVNADAAQKISQLVAKLESEKLPQKYPTQSLTKPPEQVQQSQISVQKPHEIQIMPNQQVQQTHSHPTQNTPKLTQETGAQDIEDAILAALENDDEQSESMTKDIDEYHPNYQSENKNQDIPPLNEALPVNSEMFLTDPVEAEKEQELELEDEYLTEMEKQKKQQKEQEDTQQTY